MIGDVVGRGVEAGALMAQVRTALRAYALEGHPPADVVDLLNRMFASMRPARLTTLAYIVLDPAAERLSLVSAGHLPADRGRPRRRRAAARRRGRSARRRVPGRHLPRAGGPIDPGSRVVLVTDGAAEVRGEPIDAGLERLRVLSEQEPDARRLCEAISGGAASGGPSDDDIAVLVADILALPERLSTRWPADAEALRGLRHLLRRWLAATAPSADEAYDITVAVQEAAANAVEHAYAPGAAAFTVEAEHRDGTVTVVVTDRGSWREARGKNRGRGLPLMRALMESVEVRRADGGTAVELRRTLAGGQA